MTDVLFRAQSNLFDGRGTCFAKPDPHDQVNDRVWRFAAPSPQVVVAEAHNDMGGWAYDTRPKDLTLVMAHFARTLGADGWALTLVADGAVPVCLAQGGPNGAGSDGAKSGDTRSDWPGNIDAFVTRAGATGNGTDHAPAAPIWLTDDRADGPGSGTSAFVISTPCVPGGDRLLVTLLFVEVERDERVQIERAAFHHWLPIAAYLRLWQATEVERHRASGIEAGLNFLAIGIVLLADDGKIVFANDAARALIDRQDGIREHRGRLQATNRADVAPLSNAISYALAGLGAAQNERQHEPLLALNRRQGGPLVASFGAMPTERETGGHGALVCFVDPGLDIHQFVQPVCQMFQLSRVETELVCLLVSGQTLAEAAQSLHVKIDTARGYLKHIFLKTGSNRQVDLVRLIFSNLVRTRIFTSSQNL